MTIKQLLKELQKEKYDVKELPVTVVVDGKRHEITDIDYDHLHAEVVLVSEPIGGQ